MPTPSLNEALTELRANIAAAKAAQRESGGVTGFTPIALLCLASITDGSDLTIVYRDGDGVTSVRHITVNAIERCHNGVSAVRAFDLDRMAPRSFRLERIQGAATERREVAAVEWAD